jgi:predicted oxidoreductase (fatty acid repression mutant protein)
MQEHNIDVPRRTLYQLEKEAAHVTNELEKLIDTLPSKFRKQVRRLSKETDHMYEDISHIKGLHWFAMKRTDFED